MTDFMCTAKGTSLIANRLTLSVNLLSVGRMKCNCLRRARSILIWLRLYFAGIIKDQRGLFRLVQ